VHKAGLRLVEHKYNLVRCPFRNAYIANKGDPMKHAKVCTPLLILQGLLLLYEMSTSYLV